MPSRTPSRRHLLSRPPRRRSNETLSRTTAHQSQRYSSREPERPIRLGPIQSWLPNRRTPKYPNRPSPSRRFFNFLSQLHCIALVRMGCTTKRHGHGGNGSFIRLYPLCLVAWCFPLLFWLDLYLSTTNRRKVLSRMGVHRRMGWNEASESSLCVCGYKIGELAQTDHFHFWNIGEHSIA
jgi:hypothetical protein